MSREKWCVVCMYVQLEEEEADRPLRSSFVTSSQEREEPHSVGTFRNREQAGRCLIQDPKHHCHALHRRHQGDKPGAHTLGCLLRLAYLTHHHSPRPRARSSPPTCPPHAPRSCTQPALKLLQWLHDFTNPHLLPIAPSTAAPSSSPSIGPSTATSGAARPCTSAPSSKRTRTSHSRDSKQYVYARIHTLREKDRGCREGAGRHGY